METRSARALIGCRMAFKPTFPSCVASMRPALVMLRINNEA
jgi:hypothetical protein